MCVVVFQIPQYFLVVYVTNIWVCVVNLLWVQIVFELDMFLFFCVHWCFLCPRLGKVIYRARLLDAFVASTMVG